MKYLKPDFGDKKKLNYKAFYLKIYIISKFSTKKFYFSINFMN